ncbi:MAG: hypothetical protein ACTSPQ_13125 [Candidatus Helarchaeota archaeon]
MALYNAYTLMLMCDYDNSLLPALPFLNEEPNIGEPPSEEFATMLSLYMTGDEISNEFSIYKQDCFDSWNWSRLAIWYDSNMQHVEMPNLSQYEWYEGGLENDSDSFNWNWTVFGWELVQHIPTKETTSNMLVAQEIRWKDLGIALYNDSNQNKYPDISLDVIEWEDGHSEPVLNSSELKYIFFAKDANVEIFSPVVSGNSMTFGANFDLNGSWLEIGAGSGLLWRWYKDFDSVCSAYIDNYNISFTATLTRTSLTLKQNLGISSISDLPDNNLSLSFLQEFEISESILTYDITNENTQENISPELLETDEVDSFEISFNSGTSTKVKLNITGAKYQLGDSEYDLIGSQLPIGQFTGIFFGSNIDFGTSSGSLYIISIGCPVYDKDLVLLVDPQLITSFTPSFPIMNLIIWGVPIGTVIAIISIWIYLKKRKKK